MKKNEMALVYNYIYNEQQRYEEELRQLQTNIRYRRIDVSDCTELTCAIERLNTFMQVTRNIMTLLKMKELETDDVEV